VIKLNINQEELDKKFAITSLVFSSIVVFLLFFIGLIIDPPELEGASYALLFPMPGAILSIAIIAFIGGYRQLNKRTRKQFSISLYVLSFIIVYFLTWLYYYIIYDIYFPSGEGDFYRSFYFGMWLLLGWIYVLIMIILMIIFNRLFLFLGRKFRELVSA
jgi:hypothetical protein